MEQNISPPKNGATRAFAMARHAAVDLAQIFGTPPMNPKLSRLSPADFTRMRDTLAEVGLQVRNEEDAEKRLYELRLIYEPFVNALAEHLLVNLPPWIAVTKTVDDWQTSAWDHFAQWSPARLDEITHIIVDGRKKNLLRQAPIQTDTKQSVQRSREGSGEETA